MLTDDLCIVIYQSSIIQIKMEIIGYFASALIGVSLGLIGGGGSILTVPVLVYLFGVEPVIATAYSLFIVGTTSLFGAFPKYREGQVNLKTAIIFGRGRTPQWYTNVTEEGWFGTAKELATRAQDIADDAAHGP